MKPIRLVQLAVLATIIFGVIVLATYLVKNDRAHTREMDRLEQRQEKLQDDRDQIRRSTDDMVHRALGD